MKRVALTIGLMILAGMIAACSGADAAPPTGAPSAPPSGAPSSPAVPTVTARNLAWIEKEIRVPAGTPFELVMDNQESPPHNVQIKDPSGGALFTGEIVSNQKITYQIPALAAGTYTFICEVHPDMKGTLVAE
jgi:plastocyanin